MERPNVKFSAFESQKMGFENAAVERAKALDAPFQKFKTIVVNTNKISNPQISASYTTDERPEDKFTTEITDTSNLTNVVSFSVSNVTIPLSFETVNFFSFTDTDFNPTIVPDFLTNSVLLMVFVVDVIYYRQSEVAPFDFTLTLNTSEVQVSTSPFDSSAPINLSFFVERSHWSPSTFAAKLNIILEDAATRGKAGDGIFVPGGAGLPQRNFPSLGSPSSFHVLYNTGASKFEFVRPPPIENLSPADIPKNSVTAQNTVVQQVLVAVRSSRLANLLGFGADRQAFTTIFNEARDPNNVQNLLPSALVNRVLAPLPTEPWGPSFLRLRSSLPVSSPHLENGTPCILAVIPILEGFPGVELSSPTTEFESVFTFVSPQTIEATQTFWFEDPEGKMVYFISDRRWSVTLIFKYIPVPRTIFRESR